MHTSPASKAADPRTGNTFGPRAEPLARVREVLFACDLSPESDRAFEHARFLAEHFEALLTLYHAVEVPDPSYAHWAFNRGREIWAHVEETAKKLLSHKAESLHVSHKVYVERASSAHHALLSFIRETQPDLTVMATHGREGLSHFLLGSVTESVFRHSFRPVLCVREPAHGGALPYRRILVPTDLSLASRLAFPMAATFARQFGAEVLAVHVVGSGAETAPEGVPSEAWLWKFFERDFPGVEITALVHRGPVWERIVETARVERADLIVMSTRGHDSLADRVIGSNTERVVRHAPCPVLVA
jgi:nucleotide-binding universal stress UspA family protein